jgi:hypothetical protein
VELLKMLDISIHRNKRFIFIFGWRIDSGLGIGLRFNYAAKWLIAGISDCN